MLISTRGRYALRTMIYMANHGGMERPVSIKEISENEQISVKYLEQIISLLVKNELLRSIRGARGGYLFARPMEEINAGDILRATEGTLSPVECVDAAQPACPNRGACPTFPIYKSIDDAINQAVNQFRLSDMVQAEGGCAPC